MSRDYCACIRTLGRAGEKYQTLLDSLKNQTIQPKKILVYIPHGYDLPKETIGIEEYIRCEKGMVHQRSLPFDEVDTEYMLFLDDDLLLPNDFAERMLNAIKKEGGDCICADIYNIKDESILNKVAAAIFSFVFPRFNDGWAFKLQRNSSSTYNNFPHNEVLPSQCASASNYLCKKEVFLNIHYEHERWIDEFKYAIGDDMLFTYKLYLNNYKLFVYYDSGLIHLDAQSGRIKDKKESFLLGRVVWFILWYRTRYQIEKTRSGRFLDIISFFFRDVWLFFTNTLIRALYYRRLHPLTNHFYSLYLGYKYVHSEKFKSIPSFVLIK